jgi:WD40 repeat protein
VETLPQGHRDAVVWLDVSSDGRTLASTSTDHVIKLWDLVENRFLRDLGTHKDMARTGLFLPGGTELLSAGDEGEVVLRKVDDGTVLHVFSTPDHGGARKLAVSADGKRAVSVHEKGTAIVWDLEKRAVLHVIKAHDWPMASVAISPDGTTVLTGDIAGTLKLWDITTGSLKRGWHGHERGTYGAVFTPDGRQLITGSGDFAIKVWDLKSGAELRRLDGHFGTVYALALSPDGKQLLSGSLDGTARLWDIPTGKELAQMTGHNARVYSVAFGPDGTLITGGDDRAIRVWRADGGAELAMFAGAADSAPE